MDEVYNLIRGLSPYPCASTYFNEKKLKVFRTEKVYELPSIETGNYKSDEKTFIQFACKNGYLKILNLQLEGKKRMDIGDFLRGYRF